MGKGKRRGGGRGKRGGCSLTALWLLGLTRIRAHLTPIVVSEYVSRVSSSICLPCFLCQRCSAIYIYISHPCCYVLRFCTCKNPDAATENSGKGNKLATRHRGRIEI